VAANDNSAHDDELAPSNVPSGGTKPAKKRKRTTERKPLNRLSGKALIDTYSKRSRTLMEKSRELEELTGAYVVIYTARPVTVFLTTTLDKS